jgi:hypothetical protein
VSAAEVTDSSMGARFERKEGRAADPWPGEVSDPCSQVAIGCREPFG